MILTVGDDNDGLAYFLVFGERVHGQADGFGQIGALALHHGWRDVLQKHFGRHEIVGDGKLDKCRAGENDQTYLVVVKLVHQRLDKHLALGESRRNDVLGKHGIADVHGNDGLYSRALHVLHPCTHLRSRQHHDEEGKRRKHQPELCLDTHSRHVGHQLLDERIVSKETQALAFPVVGEEMDDNQDGNRQQPI